MDGGRVAWMVEKWSSVDVWYNSVDGGCSAVCDWWIVEKCHRRVMSCPHLLNPAVLRPALRFSTKNLHLDSKK